MLKKILATSLLLAAPVAQAADDHAAGAVHEHRLANGLQLLVWPSHDIPSVAVYTFFRVGSRNERPGITGLSHFFEHMMFNGTKTRPPGTFDRLLEAAGGNNNAYTTEDVTVYQDWIPKSALSLAFDLESDRMRNLDFDPKVVESERGVVYSERRLRVDNDNAAALEELVQASAFVAHPYQIPVIGWPSDIESWKRSDLQHYYKTYYAPNNAVMVVAGDVQPDAVFALADRYYGTIKPSQLPDPVRTTEPPQAGERRVVLKRPGQAPLLQLAYHAPRAADDAVPALELLLAILAEGDSSRLYRLLVEDTRTAVSVQGQLQAGFDPGLAWLNVTLPPGGDVARVQQQIDEALARVVRDGVTDTELAKARNLKLAQFWKSLSTIAGKAQALGHCEVLGGGRARLFETPDRYAAVTGDQVRRIAAQVFRADNRTVGVLQPQAQAAPGDAP
ncbi:MAG TPA: pitrilysin family protein [Nevskiaceae bacterium]|nr:pitrilysin family protein [Nevskiaceae bacterium]